MGASHWSLVALLVCAAVLPCAVFLTLAVSERNAALTEGRYTAIRTANALTEHALKVLETQSLVIEQLDAAIKDREWAEIDRDERLHATMGRIARNFPQVHAIWLVDAQGRVHSPAGKGALASLQDRDFFRFHRDSPGSELYIGSPFTAGSPPSSQFTVSRRRSSEGSRFAGAIAVAIELDYFTRFWAQFTPQVDHVIPLMRSDGTILARYPAVNSPPRLSPAGPYMQQIAREPVKGFYVAHSLVDGIERMNAYSRIGEFPLYVSFSLETHALLANWRQRAAMYAVLGLVTSALLVAVVMLALRQSARQRDAAVAWEEAARRSEQEIRRREQLEAELVQAQKMEAVGQLTGGVAHDFNNLLHAISLNLKLVEKLSGNGPWSKFLDSASRAVDRAAQLTRQLTAFSRKQTLDARAFSPTELIVRMADLFERTLGGTIKLEVEAAADVWPCHADPAQTELALLNLAVNAKDAMPGGGRLVVAARNVSVPAATIGLAAGDYVEISMRDTGSGIPPEVLPRVFEPFFTTKEIGKGTGLGLSMVHGFASQSGGTARVVSVVGEGTTVSMLLPRADRVAQSLAETRTIEREDPRARPGARVVLAEDDSLVRTSMLLTLRGAGYEVVEAASAPEALDAIRTTPAHLLVTDYAMAGMNGLQLAAAARDVDPALAILLITGYAEPAFRSEHLACVDAVVHKPCAPNHLLQVIGSLVRTRAGGKLPVSCWNSGCA